MILQMSLFNTPQYIADKKFGGAIFGIVDHAWNGELFMISPNLFADLMLGVTITLVIFMTWFVVLASDKAAHKQEEAVKAKN